MGNLRKRSVEDRLVLPRQHTRGPGQKCTFSPASFPLLCFSCLSTPLSLVFFSSNCPKLICRNGNEDFDSASSEDDDEESFQDASRVVESEEEVWFLLFYLS